MPGVVASVNVIVAVPHASDAVGVLNDGTAGQLIVVLLPTLTKVGGVRSLVHVTILDVVAVLPQPSVAVNVLVCD